MKIEDKLTESILNGIKTLYNQEVPAKMVQLQKTKKEFEGHLTLVVFPFLKMSKKGPEQTAQEIGEYLKQNEPAIANYNVIKGLGGEGHDAAGKGNFGHHPGAADGKPAGDCAGAAHCAALCGGAHHQPDEEGLHQGKGLYPE